MESPKIRQTFLDFFKSKQHEFVASAPMVVKDDPTLMFINAGMNQFKDIFLGNKPKKYPRVANTQKCLRVSGKHNDLEEVGHDTYHHTMFEMLGNWSFGDYFKKEAISWAWELLTDVYKIDKENLYVTVYGGDQEDGLSLDQEAYDFWKAFVPEERILSGSKKDNFWEMGETGPCGPCSEIHIDIRDAAEKQKIPGKDLVNQDHPLVIEIWNLVFIEFNRKANGQLEKLPHQHIDTGMGFERLCMVLQGKKSNYDTDVFQPIIGRIAEMSGKKYGSDPSCDIAMRVIADHLRAITFAIADGQLPSNNKAGYVIRRILRRAVRYGYTFLDFKSPFINQLVQPLVDQMGAMFPELVNQQELIRKVITEEEISFLRTLETGIQLLDQIIRKMKKENYKVVKGKEAFELYDTFGFPFDLTELILREQGLVVSKREFDEEMEAQKNRSRSAASSEMADWVHLREDDQEEFIGYNQLEASIRITRYREVKQKNKTFFQLVFNITPFYAESGGQVGDTGYIETANGDKIEIIDTKKENNLIVHITQQLPAEPEGLFRAVVSAHKRALTTNNHSATHLMHHALREVLGEHVEQKGSLVNSEYLRFDFSHFQKVTKEEIRLVEQKVNQMIRQNLLLDEKREIPLEEAHEMGAMMLFGEKYGDLVRVIRFGESVELCGGTHVAASGQIGLFKIVSEGAIAAGIRRIEAITANRAEDHIQQQEDTLEAIRASLKSPANLVKSIHALLDQNTQLQKQMDVLIKEKAHQLQKELLENAELVNNIRFVSGLVELDASAIKDLAFGLKNSGEDVFVVIGAKSQGKASLTLAASEKIVQEKGIHAGKLIRDLAKAIQGGGGGQAHFATAGGKNPDGLNNALLAAKDYLTNL